MSARDIATALYWMGTDMDWMDYEECQEITVNEIEKRITADKFMRNVLERALWEYAC